MLKIQSMGEGCNLLILPGGPGLSSGTLRALEPLKNKLRLHFIDFSGTNNSDDLITDFESIARSIDNYCKTLEGKRIILGHSFGGFLAAGAFEYENLDALICISTPFTSETLDAATIEYNKNKTSELSLAEKKWIDHPSNETFSTWLSEYGNLYFQPENISAGKSLIKNDNCSYKLFLNNRADIRKNLLLIEKIMKINKKRLFIAGEDDGLLPIHRQRIDADLGGFTFRTIRNANHFPLIDRPEEVMKEVLAFIN